MSTTPHAPTRGLSSMLAGLASGGTAKKLVVIIALALVWEISVRALNVNPLLFPPLSAVTVKLLAGLGLGGNGELWRYIWETLSVILQVGSFKLRGKRIFKMAPLHHHFEALGWQESKIITRFWIVGLVMALFALTTLKLR